MTAADPATLVDLLRRRCSLTPDQIAFRHGGRDAWREVAWREVQDRIDGVAAGLHERGIRHGDRIAIAGHTSLDWVVAAFAIWQVGGTVVTVYPSTPPDTLRFLLQDSCAVAIVCEDDAQLEKVRQIRAELTDLDHVIQLGGGADDALPLHDLEGRGRLILRDDPDALTERLQDLRPDHLAALVYTSGTTGEPKGVMLTHENFVAVVEGTADALPLEPGDHQLLFLPLAHVYGLLVLLVGVHVGAPAALDGRIDRLADNLRGVRPTFLAAVPRVFEKILEQARARAQDRSTVAAGVFGWAERVAARWSDVVRRGDTPGTRLALEHRLADRLVFSKVRAGLGGALRAASSGGAPLNVPVAAFFHAAGIPILEGYGLTETAAISVANRLDDWKLGTVGKPGEGVELKLADDGEVLLRGASVMRGYWNRPDATAEVLDADGWFHTGDLGAIDAEGYLTITDRKKHLLVTSNGKNVAPAPIEARLKAASDLIEEAMVVGDSRSFCAALVWLAPDVLEAYAARHDLDGTPEELIASRPIADALEKARLATNDGQVRHEQIKRLHAIPHAPDIARGELTPSLKLRRKAIEARYATWIEALYTSDAPRSAATR